MLHSGQHSDGIRQLLQNTQWHRLKQILNLLMHNAGCRGHFWSDLRQVLFSVNMQMCVGTRQKIVFRSDVVTTLCEHETEKKQSRQPVEINLTNNKQQYRVFLLLSLTSSSHRPKPKDSALSLSPREDG